jgi:CRISPR-associated protein Cas2
MFLVIAYDIRDDRRRRRIDKALGAYGRRVNYSVFEIPRSTPALRRRIEAELRELIDPGEDSLRLYPVDLEAAARSRELGEGPDPFVSETGHVF